MDYTTLGSTGLNVSVAGLGCGGFSRLGMANGKTEAEAADLVRTALDLGVNYFDTAPRYGTEGAVGQAIRGRPRDEVIIATKVRTYRGDQLIGADVVEASINASLKTLGVDFIDVYQIHGPRIDMFDHVMHTVVPVMQKARKDGKVRHIGITESDADPDHEFLSRAADAGAIDVALMAFHMMHQTARNGLLKALERHNVGTVAMYAVRSMYARPQQLRAVIAGLAAQGKVPDDLAQREYPLDFLIHEGGCDSITEAAYRFVRHQPGIDVVLFGTGDAEHLRANVTAILKPPLPRADLAKIETLFGHLVNVGLDRHGLNPETTTSERRPGEAPLNVRCASSTRSRKSAS